MFSMCSELTPRARIPDTRIPQLMQPCPTVVLKRATTVPAFSIHLLLPQTGAVSAAENVRKDQQKMYVLSEYYSILH